MNPEAQRIAIAEACGWAFGKYAVGVRMNQPGWRGPIDRYAWVATDLPDYLNDLNAMHEAEKVLTREKQCHEMASNLASIVHGFADDPFLGPQSYIWHATSAQRAEAFLRTIGRWED